MTTRTKSVLLSISTFIFVSTLFVVPAFAQETPTKARVSNGQIYLKDAKLKYCLAREATIQIRLTSLTRMATNMLEKFDSIYTRVDSYYQRSGKTVARYSVLSADVQTKREAVTKLLDSSSAEVKEFNCAGSDPKGHMTSFQKDMKLVKSALKDYRTSIKNVIVAVRTVTATEVKQAQSPKPSPSANVDGKKTPNPKSNSQGRGNN